MKLAVFSVLALQLNFPAQAQTPQLPPKSEVRAVWITTVASLDWPKSQDPVEQRRSLLEMVTRLHAAHFNTIFFQVRGRGDAMYRSSYEPWAQQLSGTLGKDPGWDPLGFIVQEAHRRQMEVHAWFNTFLLKSSRFPLSPYLDKHRDWAKDVDGEFWLDPGLPAVREYLCAVAMDLMRHYAVDGIHFDFIRYPGKLFPDDQSYRRYGGKTPREDWRRENVNKFVRMVYDSVTALNPLLKVGSAPIGIYTDNGKVKGLRGYDDLYQDSRRWLREGKQDYLCPQLYWSLGDRTGNPDFAGLAKDWGEHAYSRQIIPGIGAYKPNVSAEIGKLVDVSRASGCAGNSFFRYGSIEGALDIGSRYRTLANIPPMKWKDGLPPGTPDNLSVTAASAGAIFRLSWGSARPAADGDRAALYDVYRSAKPPVDIDDPSNLVAILPGSAGEYHDTVTSPGAARYYYAVTALDRANNEGLPATAGVLLPEVADLARQFAPQFRMGLCYPDPATSTVFVPFEIGQPSSRVSLTVFDSGSRELAKLVDGVRPPGRYVAAFDVSSLKGGVYSFVLTSGGASLTRETRIDH